MGYGGCIGVSSEPGVATTFHFDIPLFPGTESPGVGMAQVLTHDA